MAVAGSLLKMHLITINLGILTVVVFVIMIPTVDLHVIHVRKHVVVRILKAPARIQELYAFRFSR